LKCYHLSPHLLRNDFPATGKNINALELINTPRNIASKI
jgi:hypothetical protein